jgi:hypothetical protein
LALFIRLLKKHIIYHLFESTMKVDRGAFAVLWQDDNGKHLQDLWEKSFFGNFETTFIHKVVQNSAASVVDEDIDRVSLGFCCMVLFCCYIIISGYHLVVVLDKLQENPKGFPPEGGRHHTWKACH